MKRQDYRKLTTISVLAALSFVLMLLQFPLPILPSHLQFDFSDLPAIIASFAYGPVAGVIVELIKNALHLLINPNNPTFGIGELSNFLHGVCFVLPAGLIYRYNRTKRGAILGAAGGTCVMALLSFPINYFLTIPLFARALSIPESVLLNSYQVILPWVENSATAILAFHVPLTFVKGLLCATITFLVYKRISPLLHGRTIGDVDVVEIENENGEVVEELQTVEFDYGELALHSTIKISNLTVTSVYTTNADTASKGALTITCRDANGKTIEIRTASKLVRDDQTVVVAADFPAGTVISVKGIVDYYDQYQIKVFNIDDITYVQQ